MNLGSLNEVTNYLNSHPHLINMLIFLLGLLVAWTSGALNAVKGLSQKLDNRLRIRIDPTMARVTFLKDYEHSGAKAARFAFCLSLSLLNPTEKNLTVTDFELKFKDKRRRWSKGLLPITFPNVPRQEIGENLKFLPVYFSRFPEIESIFGREFSPNGRVQPGDIQSGYLLFMEEFYGSWLPRVTNKGVRIKAGCRDLRGRSYAAKGWAQSISSEKMFSFIPGLDKYMDGEKYLSSLHRWESGIDPLSKEGKEIIRRLKEIEQDHEGQAEAKDKE